MYKEIYFTTYNKDKEKGHHIVKANLNLKEGTIEIISIKDLAGKANMILETKNQLITSVETQKSVKLEFYNKKTLELIKQYESEYFYSFGQVLENKLILSSYSKGVDSIFDLEKKEFTKSVIHSRNDFSNGKSHFIGKLKDGRVVSVENALQQIYLYKNDGLELERIVEFGLKPPMNIRLLSFSLDQKYAYLNTEYSGEIIVLDTSNFEIIERHTLSSKEGYYSGGNTISSDGKMVYISMRGEDCIYIFKAKDETIKLIDKIKCGRNPRDLKIVDDYLLASCTDENCIEVYKVDQESLIKVNSLEIERPITFSTK